MRYEQNNYDSYNNMIHTIHTQTDYDSFFFSNHKLYTRQTKGEMLWGLKRTQLFFCLNHCSGFGRLQHRGSQNYTLEGVWMADITMGCPVYIVDWYGVEQNKNHGSK